MKNKLMIKILLISLLVGFGFMIKPQNTFASTDNGRQIPTLFFHGFGGTVHSMDYLIDQSQADGYATRTLTIFVSKKGKLSFDGVWPKNAKNPEIQVLFGNNHQSDYHKTAKWINTIILALHKKYKITKFNAVAHSWGNNAVMYYLFKYGNRKNQPQIDSLVNIAAPMQVLNRDIYRRNPWRYSDQLTRDFDKYIHPDSVMQKFHIRELNIMGQLSKSDHFDKAVPVSSARSLRKVFKGPHQTYQARIFTGHLAEHSALTRRNPRVLHDIEHFLWRRN